MKTKSFCLRGHRWNEVAPSSLGERWVRIMRPVSVSELQRNGSSATGIDVLLIELPERVLREIGQYPAPIHIQPVEIERLKDQIMCKLRAEGATNLSDHTLERILRPTVGGNKLISVAKYLRNYGYISTGRQ